MTGFRSITNWVEALKISFADLRPRQKNPSLPSLKVTKISSILSEKLAHLIQGHSTHKNQNTPDKDLEIFKKIIPQNLYPEPQLLAKDPNLKNIKDILPQWLEQDIAKDEIPKWQSMVVRNLHVQNKETSEPNVKKEIQRILKQQLRYMNLALFKNRHVLFVADNTIEKSPTAEKFFFAKKASQQFIKKLSRQFEFYRIPMGSNVQEKPVKELTDKIKLAPQAFTFFFTGHGNPKKIQIKQDLTISVDDLAQAFIERNKNTISPKTQPDILIFDTCHSIQFIRSFYAKLRKANVSLPIIITAAEFGQSAFSFCDSLYSSCFIKSLADQGTTLLNVMHDHAFKGSNPSIYVPDENNRPMQIS